ncbi:MAG: AAA family ATPase, partial [Alphaproteobacteria bacterium]|nr:AAA family ATPase [Alphaproteobacteria bacterium]
MAPSPHRLDAASPPAATPPGGETAPAGKTTAEGGLALTRLSLRDFRNYSTARLESAGGCVVLCGPNGAGKTNVLEAISTLSPGRGLRGAALSDLQRHGADSGWSVAARLQTPDGDVDIGTGLSGNATESEDENDEAEPGRRLVRVDGRNAAGPAALARLLRLVWLTPQMDRLFTEGASSRRRFLDRLVLGFDPDHGRRV